MSIRQVVLPARFRTVLTFVVLLVVAGPALAIGQSSSPAVSFKGKQIRATRVDRAPSVDGRLDEAIWETAHWVSDFWQKEPDQFAEATLPTEVALVFDDGALYVGARMHHERRDEIGDLMTRRDEQGGKSEVLVVTLDTFHDRRTAYSFAVTPSGVRLDWFHPEDNEFPFDKTFDPVWTARTEIRDDGWTAEMRIPFSQLRFNGGTDQVWGINLNRWVPARNEDTYWVVIPRDERAWASRFGELVGIGDLPPNRRIELVPYVASDATFTSDGALDADDPFNDGSDANGRVGLDFKMGLGSNLTLDATVNPDFGQVEADPAEVNLSAFETFFPEQRPFFTQGQQSFTGFGSPFYYSRRIGAPPHGETDGDFDNAPSVTTILGAAKVTGQTDGGLTIGVLAAVTGEEMADEFHVDPGETNEVRVEPRTTYGVLRLQQQFGADQSTFGGTLTAVHRDVSAGTPLADELVRSAYAGGVDWNRRFNGGAYELKGHAGFSHLSGEPGAITAVQESSRRYYQRPDAGHVELDPTRTSISGWTTSVRFDKRSGKWLWGGGTWADSPGFEINDVGQINRADDFVQFGHFRFRETTPGAVFRNWEVGSRFFNRFSFDGVRRFSDAQIFSRAQLSNFWRAETQLRMELPAMSDGLTRGGPLMAVPRAWSADGNLFTDFTRTNRGGIRLSVGGDELGGWSYGVRVEALTQPSDRLTLSVVPRYRRQTVARQYIDTFDEAGGGEATFGSRYVFGRIARSEISAAIRANYSFAPDLSLELYAEPFASSGRYSDIGELAEVQTSDLRVYGAVDGTSVERDEAGDYTIFDGANSFEFDNPDFDVLSFRSNLVMRWEWSPGSTLFLVWQQNRTQDDTRGEFVGPGKLFDSFSSDGDNILAVKLAYWLPI